MFIKDIFCGSRGFLKGMGNICLLKFGGGVFLRYFFNFWWDRLYFWFLFLGKFLLLLKVVLKFFGFFLYFWLLVLKFFFKFLLVWWIFSFFFFIKFNFFWWGFFTFFRFRLLIVVLVNEDLNSFWKRIDIYFKRFSRVF